MEGKEKIILKPHKDCVCSKSYNLLNMKLLNGCNGKCEFCIAAGTPAMKSADYQKFIDTANSMTEFSKVDVLGGEPTLYPNLVEVLKGIRPHKKEIGIISNGSNLSVLKECIPYLDTITLSIHSFDYDKNSTGIHINEKELKDLNKNKGNVETIAAVVMSKDTVSNLKQIKDYARKAKKLGFSAIKLMELVTSNEEIDFVDLQDLLIDFGIHQKNATLRGCFFELPKLSKYLGIKTYVKLCCPYNNIFKAKSFGIPEIEYQQDYMNVIQPDCTVTDSWVYDSFDNKILNGGELHVNYIKK
ncbi:MAG: radical SAM protein [Ruminococcus sp.]|nr:radical SAM protein [Ruminococcus sp.]